MLGVGNGKFLQPPVLQGGGKVAQFAIRLQRRALGHQNANAPVGVQPPPVLGLARICQLEDKAFVGRHEEMERRSLQELSVEVARRTEDQTKPVTAFLLEECSNLFQRKLQVRRGGHGGHGLGIGLGGRHPKCQRSQQRPAAWPDGHGVFRSFDSSDSHAPSIAKLSRPGHVQRKSRPP